MPSAYSTFGGSSPLTESWDSSQRHQKWQLVSWFNRYVNSAISAYHH